MRKTGLVRQKTFSESVDKPKAFQLYFYVARSSPNAGDGKKPKKPAGELFPFPKKYVIMEGNQNREARENMLSDIEIAESAKLILKN